MRGFIVFRRIISRYSIPSNRFTFAKWVGLDWCTSQYMGLQIQGLVAWWQNDLPAKSFSRIYTSARSGKKFLWECLNLAQIIGDSMLTVRTSTQKWKLLTNCFQNLKPLKSYASINLTGYPPPPPPKCVPSPRAFAQQKMLGGWAYKWRCPWGREFASTGFQTWKLLTQSSELQN